MILDQRTAKLELASISIRLEGVDLTHLACGSNQARGHRKAIEKQLEGHPSVDHSDDVQCGSNPAKLTHLACHSGAIGNVKKCGNLSARSTFLLRSECM